MHTTMQLSFGEENKILPAAITWLATGDNRALAEAKRRANNLASWDAHGATGFTENDQAGLSVAWTLALAYDWLHSELSETERDRIATSIRRRMVDILGNGPYGLEDGRKLDASPYDSHGAVAMARVSAICTIMLGADPVFDRCFSDILPRYVSRPVPWGVDDGGYANGTSYGQWDVTYTHLIVWELLKYAIGVDLTQTPWANGYGTFITYFLPPGTPSGMFGDGAEQYWPNVWATQANAYAALIPSPLVEWSAREQLGEDISQLALLLAPAIDWSKVPMQIPAGTPNAVLIPSIGWVAMHSDLSDRARTSIYFKSSPYGSFNHSHADQNSFVVNAQGQRLAIDSGYYDYYNSPHWTNWYKRTLAHNAITFDGGQGQMHDTMAAKGKISQFEASSAYDMVTGDATQAYGGALTHAVRSMIYVRPSTLLVFDSLASDKPRTWEWNIHALKSMHVNDDRSIEIEQQGVHLCVDVLSGPVMTFTQTDQFTPPPSGSYPNQWHGAFKSKDPSKVMHMLTMLSVDCEHPPVGINKQRGNLEVSLGRYRFLFSDTSAQTVQ
ncbi:MAG: heparinase II/III family protein [Thiobacillaceae bacterium]